MSPLQHASGRRRNEVRQRGKAGEEYGSNLKQLGDQRHNTLKETMLRPESLRVAAPLEV